ncbi:uncharacterized protein [Watersipora subatra]|uniref:uncharacterized protein n=1 Tax=Watersipora subatra TaxID=2589382 RepID=UPI00355B6E21
MGTVRPAPPSQRTLQTIDGVCQYPQFGRITPGHNFAILAESGGSPTYKVRNVLSSSNLRIRLALMYRKEKNGYVFVCPYGLSGCDAFTEKDGMLYQDLNEARLIEFSGLKIVCEDLELCEPQRLIRCDLLGKVADKSPTEVPDNLVIQMDIFDGDYLIHSIQLEDIFVPGTTTEPTVHGSSSEVENNHSSSSGNALPNTPMLDSQPNVWTMPCSRSEQPIEDQDSGETVEMAITESPSEGDEDYNEDLDGYDV